MPFSHNLTDCASSVYAIDISIKNGGVMSYYGEAQKRYVKSKRKIVCLNLNRGTQALVIEWLESKGNVSAYILRLIEEDMKHEGKVNQ